MSNICDINLDEWLRGDEQERRRQLELNWNEIPFLDALHANNLQEHKLVRFRGMIQDMFNPEFYFESYEVINKVTREKSMKMGKYRESAYCASNEYLNLTCKDNVTKERQTYVVITPPGLNKWALEVRFASNLHVSNVQSPSGCCVKRGLEQSDENIEMEVSHSTVSFNPPCVDAVNKKQRTEANQTNEDAHKLVISREHLLNLPLSDREGRAVHIKIYEGGDRLKLNELVDCIGFLSMDAFYQNVDDVDDDDEIGDLQSEIMEIQTHNPPTSLIPKLHCVAIRQLQHSNPLLDDIRLEDEPNRVDIQAARNELERILTEIMLGDKLAAEYMLYHLISRVYSRLELMPLGKFSINFINVPSLSLPEYGKTISGILEEILCKSYYLPMNLENMNELAFIPKKDYECNRITSGILQLSDNTHLILDETKLTEGKLNQGGVKAIAALSNIIRNQSASYDFNYYHMDFPTNIPIVILSERKSLLPSDIQLCLLPREEYIAAFADVIAALKVSMTPNILTAIRKFLTRQRFAKYEISDSINQLVQNEFVAMRVDKRCTTEDLHNLLVLARYVCLADGKSVLDDVCWNRACALERERKKRLAVFR